MPEPKTDFSPETKPGTGNKPRRLVSWFKSRETLLVVALLTTCCFLLYRNFLLGDGLYLFKDIGSDSLNIAYPTYYHIATYLRTYGIPGWSFNIGLGQDLFPFSLGNPFELFLVLLPPHLVGYGIIYAECAKTILSGMFIYKAFRLSLFSRPVALLGCVLYAFSGYMVVGGQWNIFSVEAFHVAFLIYAFERYLLDRKTGYLIAAFYLISAFMPFNLYLMSFFLFLYGFWRLGNRRESGKTIVSRIIDVAGSLFAGTSLAAVFFLPALNQLAQTPRAAGFIQNIIKSFGWGLFQLDEAHYYITMFLRMFSSDLELFLVDKANYLEAPMVYMGLPVILLAPFCFAGQDRRYRVSTGIVLSITAAILIFPVIRYDFWLGTTAYVRFTALMFCTFLLIAVLNGLEHCDCWKKRHLMLLTAMIALCLFALFKHPGPEIRLWRKVEIRNLVLGFIALHGLLITVLTLSGRKKLLLLLMLATVSAEVIAINSFSVNGREIVTREEQEGHFGYNDSSIDAIRLIKASDPGFYRIAKGYSSSPTRTSLNDGMVQDYYGVSAYQRFNHPNFIRFLNSVGVIDKIDQDSSRWISGLNNNPPLLSLLNTKYLLTKNENGAAFLKNGY